MNDVSLNRELFFATILKQVKLKVARCELEMLFEILKYMALTYNVDSLENKIEIYNAYKLMMRLQQRIFGPPQKQYTFNLNISECYNIKKAYMLYPSNISILAKIYMEIDSQIR